MFKINRFARCTASLLDTSLDNPVVNLLIIQYICQYCVTAATTLTLNAVNVVILTARPVTGHPTSTAPAAISTRIYMPAIAWRRVQTGSLVTMKRAPVSGAKVIAGRASVSLVARRAWRRSSCTNNNAPCVARRRRTAIAVSVMKLPVSSIIIINKKLVAKHMSFKIPLWI